MKYLKLMRVFHYTKNILIFLPLVFSGNLFNITMLIDCMLAFLAFSFMTSVVYITNDISDIQQDKMHPKKRERPLASGAITIANANILRIVLFIVAVILSLLSSKYHILANAILGLYFILNWMYSKGLKNQPLVDVAILATGFVLRVLYGSAINDIVVSNWLYLTIITFAFYLGLGKRRNEFRNLKGNDDTRKVLKQYNYEFLNNNMYMCLTSGIIFYALWTLDSPSTNVLIWTVPLLILVVMKYNLIIEGASDGDPVEVLLSDKLLLGLVLLVGCIMLFGVYGV